MTAQATTCPAAPSAPANAAPRRMVGAPWAPWAAAVTVVVALLGAGICVTGLPADLPGIHLPGTSAH